MRSNNRRSRRTHQSISFLDRTLYKAVIAAELVCETAQTWANFMAKPRRPSIKYWLLAMAIVLCGFVGYVWWDMDSMMQTFRMTNQVYQEVRSPDGRYMATLAYSDGLTYGYYFVSLVPVTGWHRLQPDDPIPHDEVAEVAAEGLDTISWKGTDELVVNYEKSGTEAAQFVIQKRAWRDVHIVYRGA